MRNNRAVLRVNVMVAIGGSVGSEVVWNQKGDPKRKMAASWTIPLVPVKKSGRNRHCSTMNRYGSTIVAWFQTAATIGIAAATCAPREKRCINEDIRIFPVDDIGRKIQHVPYSYKI